MNKEFNLELCMTRDGGRCKTRDGRDARIICTDKVRDEELVYLTYNIGPDGANYETTNLAWKNGRKSPHVECNTDLFNLTVKKQKWINVYKEDLSRIYCDRKYFDLEEEAFKNKRNDLNYIKTILIHEWEE